ncbi:hypothetical protein J3E69DRAFT_323674 [Trichoderma sp. SZMC 28015]
MVMNCIGLGELSIYVRMESIARRYIHTRTDKKKKKKRKKEGICSMGFQLKKDQDRIEIAATVQLSLRHQQGSWVVAAWADKSPSPTSTIPELGMTPIYTNNRSCPQTESLIVDEAASDSILARPKWINSPEAPFPPPQPRLRKASLPCIRSSVLRAHRRSAKKASHLTSISHQFERGEGAKLQQKGLSMARDSWSFRGPNTAWVRGN